MKKVGKLTPRKKAVILALSKEGLSSRSIGLRVDIAHSSVVRLLQKFRSQGTVERKRGSGRRKKTTAGDDRVLRRLSMTNRRLTSTALRSEWVTHTRVEVSARTVRRRLFNMGLKAYRPRKKPLLTVAMRKNRLAWSKEHAVWTLDDWKKVIFSDESKFNIHGSDGIKYVRRMPHEAYSPQCLDLTVKHPLSVMVWGCFSWHGVGRLHVVEGNMNSEKYIQVLETRLLPTIQDHYGEVDDIIFQDDSAPCHRSRAVNEYLNSVGVQRLTWPGNSPDLNPIENCWKTMGNLVAAKKSTSKRTLIERLVHVWNHELKQQYLQSLIESMPRRCQAVIKARGYSTKY